VGLNTTCRGNPQPGRAGIRGLTLHLDTNLEHYLWRLLYQFLKTNHVISGSVVHGHNSLSNTPFKGFSSQLPHFFMPILELILKWQLFQILISKLSFRHTQIKILDYSFLGIHVSAK
jgi:hypothetical protein